MYLYTNDTGAPYFFLNWGITDEDTVPRSEEMNELLIPYPWNRHPDIDGALPTPCRLPRAPSQSTPRGGHCSDFHPTGQRCPFLGFRGTEPHRTCSSVCVCWTRPRGCNLEILSLSFRVVGFIYAIFICLSFWKLIDVF